MRRMRHETHETHEAHERATSVVSFGGRGVRVTGHVTLCATSMGICGGAADPSSCTLVSVQCLWASRAALHVLQKNALPQ